MKVAVVSSAVVFALVAAAGAAATSKVIGNGVRLKGTNVWYAQGKARTPRTISVRVVPNPPQPVKVQWSVACQKPNAHDPAYHLDATGKSGQASVSTAATVKLVLPYPKAPACVAAVYATLAKNGGLTVRLYQT